MEAWGFIWVMLVLKIPLALLLWLVWWAIHQTPEPEGTEGDDDGGLGSANPHPPRPLPPAPRRRGSHGDPAPQSPPRTREPARQRPPVSR